MSEIRFNTRFKEITGHDPLSWQARLFRDFFATGDLSRVNVIDLPTGLGKTMIMAIWLIAREVNQQLPRRLIYVVDRRTVVDQATELASKLRDRLIENNVEISTLRGQLADNREWSRDPSKSAIIIGTVDLIGSALLFSSYRSSFKRRPLEAGLLGQDSLLVLDEAHLSKPFEKLITAISSFQSGQGAPIKVIRMSATTSGSVTGASFTLEYDSLGNLTGEDATDATITERIRAKKSLSITSTDSMIDAIAAAAGKLATDHPGSRIVIFVKAPRQVDEVRKALIRKDKSREAKIAMLTGTMRGLERDELVMAPTDESQHERLVMQRFLVPENDMSKGECFLISTSAGEVGFDLNADHMVCDAAPMDSLIQRLGRVNRRGKSNATIRLFVGTPKKAESEDKPQKLEGFELSIANTIDLLRLAMNGKDFLDVSPQNIAALKSFDTWKNKYAAACSPEPTMVDLTDILLDAWSMTSIVTPMPGRPEVAPWIRGVADELPQTTIAWREELDLPGFDQLDLEDVEEWFDTHRVLTHETLSVPTDVAAKWFTDRWGKLTEAQQRDVGPRSLVVDRAGLKRVTITELINQISRKSGDTTAAIRNADIILPASFGGIERGKGMLDADAPELPKDDNKQPTSPDVADERGRCRQLVTKAEDGDTVIETVGSGAKPLKAAKLVLNLESDYDGRIQLISLVPNHEKLEFGARKQTLSEHAGLVRKHMDGILTRLDVPESIKLAAEIAADFHDYGKNRERWQRTVNGTATPSGPPWSDDTLGKSGGEMKHDPRGYRHEFGSLRELTDAFVAGKLVDASGKPIAKNAFDLAMHLIAVHHGRGRPHFPKGGFDPDAEDRSSGLHTESIQRFARLQRKYGWWRLAWLENLLRCADALASAGPDVEDRFKVSAGGAK